MTDKMTATERLRQLLDERGAEWSDVDTRTGESSDYVTDWNVPCHGWAVGREIGGHISYTWVMGERFTPEQAVEATLGRGTCKVEDSIDYGEFGCWQYDLSCGCRIIWPDNEPPTFCPECGRRVVE